MATIAVVNAKQEKLFRLSDSERAEKFAELLERLNRRDFLKNEKKAYDDEANDQIKANDTEIAKLREDLGEPESHLGPQMKAARDEERGR